LRHQKLSPDSSAFFWPFLECAAGLFCSAFNLSLTFTVAVVVAFAYQLINLTAYKLKKRIQSGAQKSVHRTPKPPFFCTTSAHPRHIMHSSVSVICLYAFGGNFPLYAFLTEQRHQ